MTHFIQDFGTSWYTHLFFICLLTAMMILLVTGADANIEAELGDSLNLHCVSYTGGSDYRIMTGPGLPENGISLTDVTQRADKRQFKRIDLDSNQE